MRQRDRPLAGKESEGGPALIALIIGLAGDFDEARQRLGNGDGLARLGQFYLSLVDAAGDDDAIRNDIAAPVPHGQPPEAVEVAWTSAATTPSRSALQPMLGM